MTYVWRKGAVRLLGFGLTGLVMVSAATAQSPSRRQHRETNAARQARIEHNIRETYTRKYEVFGGGGYLRFRSGEFLQKNNEVTWHANVNYMMTPRWGVTGDARGLFGNAKAFTNNIYGVYHPQINEYTFMGGINYRLMAKEKTALSVQGMGGVGWGIFSGGSKAIPGALLGLWPDGFKPAFAANLNYDYNFYPNLAFRVTPTYVGTTFGGKLQNNLGIDAGVVYRFGRIKNQ